MMVVGERIFEEPKVDPPSPEAVAAAQAIAGVEELRGRVSELEGKPDGTEALQGRVGALEDKQEKIEARLQKTAGKPGMTIGDMQAELERFRKLFEFVEGVLPREKAEAMSFFSKGGGAVSGGGSGGGATADGAGAALPPAVDLERHRAQLQEEVRKHGESIREDCEKLSMAIRGLQRDVGRGAGRTDDLASRISRLESAKKAGQDVGADVGMTTAGGYPAYGTSATAAVADLGPSARISASELPFDPADPAAEPPPGAALADGESRRPPEIVVPDRPPALGDLSHLLETGGGSTPLPFVSKRTLKQALENLMDELRHWFDTMHHQMHASLRHKADINDLRDLMAQISHGFGLEGDSVAMFAKRALLGKCASCDAAFNVDEKLVKRPQPIGNTPQFPPRGSMGAQVTIRPPEPVKLTAVAAGTSDKGGNRLPKIGQKPAANKNFPKGKVIKNNSSPDLRRPLTPPDE